MLDLLKHLDLVNPSGRVNTQGLRLKFSSLSTTLAKDLWLIASSLPTAACEPCIYYSPPWAGHSSNLPEHYSRVLNRSGHETRNTPTKTSEESWNYMCHRIIMPQRPVILTKHPSKHAYKDPKYVDANDNLSPFARRIANGKT